MDKNRSGGKRPEPLSAEKRAEIVRRWQQHKCGKVVTVYGQSILFREWLDHAPADEKALLAEIDRLQRENTALRKIASSLPIQYAAFVKEFGEGEGQEP